MEHDDEHYNDRQKDNQWTQVERYLWQIFVIIANQPSPKGSDV